MRGRAVIGLILVALFLITCGSSSPGKLPSSPDYRAGIDHVPSRPDRENDIPAQPMSGKTATVYFQDENIRAGWNMGNTLDSHSNGESGETYWGNPRINQELMNGLKAAGFDIIRIPVTWMGQFGEGPDYRIKESWLKRVAEVSMMAHQAGLKVVINLHHDGATSSPTNEVGWLSINTARRSIEGRQQVTFQYVRIWKQIALYFKNYGDWLMFESVNEIHDGRWGHNSFDQMMPQFTILNSWNQLFTDVVRESGGNNAERYLIIPGYCTTVPHTLGNNFKLPQDSAPGRQVVTFHYYDPYQFGIEGKRFEWGSGADKSQVDKDFAPFQERFINNDIPVIIGECGAVLQLYPEDSAKEGVARQSRRDYIAHIFGTAKKYGLVPIYWDNGAITGKGEKFGLFNRTNGTPNSPESDFLIKAMINAVR
jgi:endoglucanase